MNLPPYAIRLLRFLRTVADDGATQDEVHANIVISVDDLDHALTLLGPIHAGAVVGGRRDGTMRQVYRVTELGQSLVTDQPRTGPVRKVAAPSILDSEIQNTEVPAPQAPRTGPVRKYAVVGEPDHSKGITSGPVYAGPLRKGPVRKS